MAERCQSIPSGTPQTAARRPPGWQSPKGGSFASHPPILTVDPGAGNPDKGTHFLQGLAKERLFLDIRTFVLYNSSHIVSFIPEHEGSLGAPSRTLPEE